MNKRYTLLAVTLVLLSAYKLCADDIKVVEQQGELESKVESSVYLGEFLRPWELISPDEYIEINYENAELTTLIRYFEQKYGLRFILDDIVQPMPSGGRSPVGIKFSFTTHRAMNPKEAWDFFLAILNMAMLAVRPGPDERTYYLTTNAPLSPMSVNKGALPTFIGVDPSLIPNNDTKIRYVYFAKNANMQTLVNVMTKMLSPSHASPIVAEEVNAIIMTDVASNVRAVLDVIKELDSAVIPETLVIMRLEKADATKVKALYDSLVQEERTLLQRINPTGKRAQSSFFSENIRVFAWPPANKLFILGPRGGVSRLEEFIRREIDKESDLPYSPLHVYPLKFVGCKEMEQLINELKNFQPDSEAAKVGGLVGNTRLLKPTVTVAAEQSTNSLIINADYDDYLQLRDLLQKVDVEQPQVALRILVLDVNMQHQKDFGIQMRNMKPGLDGVLGQNVNFQTSGLPFGNDTFSSIVQRTQDAQGNVVGGAQRLLGDLVTIAGSNVPGSTLVTLGQDIYGVWGLFKILDTILSTTVVAKPFLLVTNKYNAQISVGQIFRVPV